jgi:hypothetical protein
MSLLTSTATKHEGPTSAFELRISILEDSLANCQSQLASLQQRVIANILDTAIADNRILPNERKLWQLELIEHFETASASLANAKPSLKQAARTDNLPRRDTAPPSGEQRQKRLLALVNERMRTTRTTYHEAWLQTRGDHPELF